MKLKNKFKEIIVITRLFIFNLLFIIFYIDTKIMIRFIFCRIYIEGNKKKKKKI